jgi:hypothetical protein
MLLTENGYPALLLKQENTLCKGSLNIGLRAVACLKRYTIVIFYLASGSRSTWRIKGWSSATNFDTLQISQEQGFSSWKLVSGVPDFRVAYYL